MEKIWAWIEEHSTEVLIGILLIISCWLAGLGFGMIWRSMS